MGKNGHHTKCMMTGQTWQQLNVMAYKQIGGHISKGPRPTITTLLNHLHNNQFLPLLIGVFYLLKGAL
jgi:hypothetical protein